MAPPLRLHAFLPASRANGPGLRAVVWTQGCTLGCSGCFNPETHPFGGFLVGVDHVFQWILAAGGIDGLTISGGEPLQQRPALRGLLQRVRDETDLSVLLFTGYEIDEIPRMPGATEVLSYVDVLVAGRYLERARQAPAGTGLLGSANQAVHFLTDRYSAADIADVPAAELVITSDGDVVLSGIDPPLP